MAVCSRCEWFSSFFSLRLSVSGGRFFLEYMPFKSECSFLECALFKMRRILILFFKMSYSSFFKRACTRADKYKNRQVEPEATAKWKCEAPVRCARMAMVLRDIVS